LRAVQPKAPPMVPSRSTASRAHRQSSAQAGLAVKTARAQPRTVLGPSARTQTVKAMLMAHPLSPQAVAGLRTASRGRTLMAHPLSPQATARAKAILPPSVPVVRLVPVPSPVAADPAPR